MKTNYLLGLLVWTTIAWAQPNSPSGNNPTPCPPNKDLGCNPKEIPPPDSFTVNPAGGPRCKIIKREFLNEVKSQNGCMFTLTRTYIAHSKCGQIYSCVQLITWKEDKIPPVIHCPKDTQIICPPKINGLAGNGVNNDPVPAVLAVLATDNCDGLIPAKFKKDSVVTVGCETVIYRTYEAKDACGNIGICVQKIYIYRDHEKPKITCPETWILGCTTLVDVLEPIKFAEAVDNCQMHNIMYNDGFGLVTVTNCIATKVRLWIATDRCGNQSTCEQKIQWKIDGLGPEIKFCGEDINYGCIRINPDLPKPDVNLLIVMDNCGGQLKKTVVVDTTITNGCMFLVRHIYKVEDECGNSTKCEREFRWKIVSQPPVDIPFPNNIVLQCEMPNLPVNPPTNPTCFVSVPVIVDIDTVGVCPQSCQLNVTWRKYDCFGNYTEHIQNIFIFCGRDNLIAPKHTFNTNWNQAGLNKWQIQFEVPTQTAQLQVVDMMGKVWITRHLPTGLSNTDLDLSLLSTGIYIVNIKNGTHITSKKIIISN